MKRKEFFKKTMLGGLALSIVPSKILGENSTYTKLAQGLATPIGFNHIPKTNTTTSMKKIIHKAQSRGHANHGWLDTHHTFSFANYYNPERMHFGVLRVLNDDKVAAGRGFGTHPHDNMEIISIPLSGDLEHKDSMGNTAVIKSGDVQVMSAGTGIQHSEYNRNANQDVEFLQIWMFPREKNVTPRYDQITLRSEEVQNTFYQILSPSQNDEGVWVHQDAWFHLGEFNQAKSISYAYKKGGNGLYVFLIEGSAKIAGEQLSKRDGIGIWDTNSVEFDIASGSKILLMEVPMTL